MTYLPTNFPQDFGVNPMFYVLTAGLILFIGILLYYAVKSFFPKKAPTITPEVTK